GECVSAASAKAATGSDCPHRADRPARASCPEAGSAGARCPRSASARSACAGCASAGTAATTTTTDPGAVVPANLRPAQLTLNARLRPDRDRLLEPPDHLRGLRHERPKGRIAAAELGL